MLDAAGISRGTFFFPRTSKDAFARASLERDAAEGHALEERQPCRGTSADPEVSGSFCSDGSAKPRAP